MEFTQNRAAQLVETNKQDNSVATSLLPLHGSCGLAGDKGSVRTSGLRLGLREWRLLLADSTEQSESEESELECLTRLPWACARCADKLSVNTHTNIRVRSEYFHSRAEQTVTFTAHNHNMYTFVIKYLWPFQEAGSWDSFRRTRQTTQAYHPQGLEHWTQPATLSEILLLLHILIRS